MNEIVELLLRMGHIVAAVALAGSAWFWYLAIQPASSSAGADTMTAIRRRWAPVVHASTAVLLATGLYNFISNVMTYQLPPWYHALGLVKLLLALALMFIMGKLVGFSAGAAKFQQQSQRWLAIAATLALLLVGVGSVMRSAPRPLKITEPTESNSAPSSTTSPSERPYLPIVLDTAATRSSDG